MGATARDAAVLGAMRRETDSAFASLLSASATYARDSIAAVQAIGALVWRPSARSPWQLEGGATGAAFGLSAIGRGGNASLYTHARRDVGVLTLWGGMALGHTVREGISAHSTNVDAGGTIRTGPLDLEASYARGRTEDSLLLASSRIFMRQRSPYLDIEDVALTARWASANVEISASQTWRRGVQATDAQQSATFVSAAWPLSARYAVAVAGGRLLADPVRGNPDATLVMALLRVSFVSDTDEPAMAITSTTRLLPTADGALLLVRVHAQADAVVEVAGSFNDWKPIPMRRVNGEFEAEIPLPRGRHRVAFRVDGSKWAAPGSLGKLEEFDGTVGIVVIP